MDRPRAGLNLKRDCWVGVVLLGVLLASSAQGQPVQIADPNLDGSVRWKSIDQMKSYRGSRLWGSGGCFAVW